MPEGDQPGGRTKTYVRLYVCTYVRSCARSSCARRVGVTHGNRYVRTRERTYVRKQFAFRRRFHVRMYVRTYVYFLKPQAVPNGTYVRTIAHGRRSITVSTYLPFHLRTYLRTYLGTVPFHLRSHLHVRTVSPTYVRTHLRTVRTVSPTYVRTYARTYVLTYLRTYLHTYVRHVRTVSPTYVRAALVSFTYARRFNCCFPRDGRVGGEGRRFGWPSRGQQPAGYPIVAAKTRDR